MVSSALIHNSYNELYKAMRKYVWDFPVVSALADLEVSTYKKFQDLSDTKTKFYRLRSLIVDMFPIDEELKNVYDAFEEILENTEVFVKINKVEEVLQV